MNNPSQPTDPSQSLSLNGFDRHRLEQLRRLAKLSLSEKLDWLEQAQRVAEHLRRSPARSAERTTKP